MRSYDEVLYRRRSVSVTVDVETATHRWRDLASSEVCLDLRYLRHVSGSLDLEQSRQAILTQQGRRLLVLVVSGPSIERTSRRRTVS